MHYLDLVLTPDRDGIHPVDEALAAADGVVRESLLHMDAFGDWSGVLLYRLSGDPATAVDVVAGHDQVRAYDVFDADVTDPFHLYLHVGAGEPGSSLVELTYRHALIVDTPIEFTETGSVRATVVGSHDMLRAALSDIPDHIDVSVRQVGEYTLGTRDVLALLTDRQREVFETAVERGYYDVPRRIKQEELASDLGLALSTLDEHLRKAESKLLSTLRHAPAIDGVAQG